MSTMIGAQLYTLRDFLKTPPDIAKTLKKVREIGYEAVQLSAVGPIDPKELRKLLDGEGLSVCATHASYEKMRDNPEAVLEEHRILKCTNTAIGGLPNDYRNRDGYHRFAKEASVVCAKTRGRRRDVGLSQSQFRTGEIQRPQRP